MTGRGRAFRDAYEAKVLASLAVDGKTPTIAAIETQATFAEQHSRPDMMLTLADGRRIACEHKIDANETPGITADGEAVAQLERYMALPDIAYVTYFRSAFSTLREGVRLHPRYLRPTDGPHFLWRDLYDPLCAGQHALTQWLRDGFVKLGFTPPHPDIGELWPDDNLEVKKNQENFGKLWDRTRHKLDSSFKVTVDRRAGLYLMPLRPMPIKLANVCPAGQGGSLLRLRVHAEEARFQEVRERLEELAVALPVQPEVVAGQLRGGQHYVDLLAPLRSVLGLDADVRVYEARLFDQVVPVLEALAAAADRCEPRICALDEMGVPLTESIVSRISVVQDDIARLAVDAIVNAANASLLRGSGVCGAIHEAAGPELEAECRKLGGCPPGEARMTKGYKLPARFVIHAVGPVYSSGDTAQAGLLRACYKSSLRLAAEAGVSSIAFPPIATGIYGYPKDEAADIAISAVCDWLRSADLPRSVVFCCHGAETADLYRRKLEALASREEGDEPF